VFVRFNVYIFKFVISTCNKVGTLFKCFFIFIYLWLLKKMGLIKQDATKNVLEEVRVGEKDIIVNVLQST